MAEQVKLKIVDSSGAEAGTRAISSDLVTGRVPSSLLHQVVRWQRAKKRSGTHKVQTRAEMTGGGAKPWKQKGTGRARAGSNTSPLWVGGGVAHGPKPRDYEFRLNKRERRQALIGALSARHREGQLVLVKDFQLQKASTKTAAKVLQAIGVPQGATSVVVVPNGDMVLGNSFRNLKGVSVLSANGLNVYDILKSSYLIVVDSALDSIVGRLSAE